jgi:hypothetical protein
MLDLFPKSDTWRQSIFKHYGFDFQTKTKGMDWNEIAALWEAENGKHPITHWVEWSSGNCDYDRVLSGFVSVGWESLLPPRPLRGLTLKPYHGW